MSRSGSRGVHWPQRDQACGDEISSPWRELRVRRGVSSAPGGRPVGGSTEGAGIIDQMSRGGGKGGRQVGRGGEGSSGRGRTRQGGAGGEGGGVRFPTSPKPAWGYFMPSLSLSRFRRIGRGEAKSSGVATSVAFAKGTGRALAPYIGPPILLERIFYFCYPPHIRGVWLTRIAPRHGKTRADSSPWHMMLPGVSEALANRRGRGGGGGREGERSMSAWSVTPTHCNG